MTLDAAIGKDHLKADARAGLVVFLVAVPLCLGIALASGAPLLGGLVAGAVGGLVVAFLSGSHVSVSGPAAGLTVIVATAIVSLGSYEAFLVAVVLAGVLQLVFGVVRLGVFGDYVPASVIRGMLAAIGIVIVLKQIPHALGRDSDFEGEMSFLEPNGQENTLSAIVKAVLSMNPGAALVAVVSLALLLSWEPVLSKKLKALELVPAALAVVVVGTGLNELFGVIAPALQVTAFDGHLVALPLPQNPAELWQMLPSPSWSAFTSQQVWTVAFTLAVVASLESLLSLEASEKLDPMRRYASPHRELLAQGAGNIASGLLGGLPVTSVIVRTSANVYAGGKTRWAAVIHSLMLIAAMLFAAPLLNRIPLAALAALLITVGVKLAPPKLFKQMWREGLDVFIPFLITVGAIVFTDLLRGVLVGLAAGVFFVIRANHRAAMTLVVKDDYALLRFQKDLTFINKAELKAKLAQVPEKSRLIVDGSRSLHLDKDVFDVIDDFKETAKFKDIAIEMKNMQGKRPAVSHASTGAH